MRLSTPTFFFFILLFLRYLSPLLGIIDPMDTRLRTAQRRAFIGDDKEGLYLQLQLHAGWRFSAPRVQIAPSITPIATHLRSFWRACSNENCWNCAGSNSLGRMGAMIVAQLSDGTDVVLALCCDSCRDSYLSLWT